MIHIYVHYPTITEAKKISKIILSKRLAGCISFVKQEDMYWWQGKIVGTKGVVTYVAAPKRNYKKIETLVKKYHSYKEPCIIELPVNRVLKSYAQWLKKETK